MIARLALIVMAFAALASDRVAARRWSSRAPDFHPHWTHVGSAPLDATQPIILALKENNMDILEQKFHEIHDPTHPTWLQHLSQQEIHDLTALPVKDTNRIQNWLKDAGVSKESITYGLASGAIQFTANVSVINQLFNTTIAVFEHKKHKTRAMAHIGDAHLPDHFTGLIEFADGLHFLPIQNRNHIHIFEIDEIPEIPIDDSNDNSNHQSQIVNENSTFSSRRLLQSGSFLPIYPVNSLYSWYNAPDESSFTKAAGSAYPNNNVDVIQFWTGEENSFSPDDLATYSYLWSNSQSRTTLRADHIIGPNNAADPKPEPSLDIQSITAWNPRASANFENQPVESYQMYAWATSFLGRTNISQVASISYGLAEVIYITGGTSTVDGIPANVYLDRTNSQFMKIGLRGTTILASSGDDGANSEQNTQCNYASSYEYSQYGLLADFPASSPYVTAVGGTAINDLTSSHYSATMTGGALMCNNFDTTEFRGYGLNTATTARSYRCFQSAGAVSRSTQPETVCSLDNCGITSGGGFSRQFAMPSWQSTVVNAYVNRGASGMPTGLYDRTKRAIPDVSMYGAPFPVIIGKTFQQVAGTSLAAPLFAGVISQLNALTRTAVRQSIGFANPLLYQMAAAQSSTFFDITSGNNNCPRNRPTWTTDAACLSAGCKGFPATAGWDAATGLGVPNVNNMLAYMTNLLNNRQFSGANDTGSVSDISGAANSASSQINFSACFVAVILFNFFVFALLQ